MQYYIDDERRNRPEKPDPNAGRSEQIGGRKKYSLPERLIIAVSRPSELLPVALQKTSRAVGYFVFLMLLVGIMTSLIPSAATVIGFGGFRNLFLHKMPAFTLESGDLHADSSWDMMLSGIHLYMDTDKDTLTEEDLPYGGIYVAFSRKNLSLLILQDTGSDRELTNVYSVPLKDIFPDGFNNQKLADSAWAYYLMIAVAFVLAVIRGGIRYLFLSVLYALYANAILAHTTVDVRSRDCVILAIYAETLEILIVNLNAALGTLIPFTIAAVAGICLTFSRIRRAAKPYLKQTGGPPSQTWH